jgi:hypothetical protein
LRESEPLVVERVAILSPDISVEDWNDVMSNCPPRHVGRLRTEIWQKLFARATLPTPSAELNHEKGWRTRPKMAPINNLFCSFMRLSSSYSGIVRASDKSPYCVLFADGYIRGIDTWGAGVMVCASRCSVRGGQ